MLVIARKNGRRRRLRLIEREQAGVDYMEVPAITICSFLAFRFKQSSLISIHQLAFCSKRSMDRLQHSEPVGGMSPIVSGPVVAALSLSSQ